MSDGLLPFVHLALGAAMMGRTYSNGRRGLDATASHLT